MSQGGITMASNPGQNVHLVLPHNRSCRSVLFSSRQRIESTRPLVKFISKCRRVISSCCRVISSCRRVISSCRRVISSCHYSFILQLVVLPFNSSCRLSTLRATISCTVLRKRGDLGEYEKTVFHDNLNTQDSFFPVANDLNES